MMNRSQNISPGIYLIVDPSMDEHLLMDKLAVVVKEKISALQIWDHFEGVSQPGLLVERICTLCRANSIPVLINNRWEYLQTIPLDGVHFDEIPASLATIRQAIARPFLCGITCNNDLSVIQWAADHELDYISFCSMFPSSTANSCELVSYDTVQKANAIFSKPIFLAGGINPNNIHQLNELDYSGIAVVSGIMSAEHPGESVRNYYKQLKKL